MRFSVCDAFHNGNNWEPVQYWPEDLEAESKDEAIKEIQERLRENNDLWADEEGFVPVEGVIVREWDEAEDDYSTETFIVRVPA